MKKFAIVAIVSMVVLGIAWAQDSEQPRRGGGFGNMTEEQRQAMRDRFANMSEEERAQWREQMQARAGVAGGFRGRAMTTEDQLAAIKVIEEQTAKLKASIEGYERPDRDAMANMSEDERTKFRAKMMQTFNDRREIIALLQEKIDSLSMSRPEPTLTREDIQEMGEIQKLAVEEKAAKTADRLAKLLAKFQPARGPGGFGGPRVPRPGAEGDAPVRRPRDRGANAEN